MTPNQIKALQELGIGMTYRKASDLDAHPRTLTSLADAGLVERKWRVSTSRNGDVAAYRLSMAGYRVLRTLNLN